MKHKAKLETWYLKFAALQPTIEVPKGLRSVGFLYHVSDLCLCNVIAMELE